ncbi:MAG TPA: hypothetical protein VI462_14665 [Acidimicrobiia bacterium]
MPPSSKRPAGAPQVLPYLYYPDAARALAFLIDAFDFAEIDALRDDAGQVFTAQVSTGDGVVLIGPEMAAFGTQSVTDPQWATSPPSSTSTMLRAIASGPARRARRSSRSLEIMGRIGSTSRATAADNSGSSPRRSPSRLADGNDEPTNEPARP